MRPFLFGMSFTWVVLLAWTVLRAREGGEPAPNPLALTSAEQALVRQLAEQALQERGLLKGKVCLARIEAFRDTADKAAARNALVTHYRYEGDLAIFTSVNLGRKEVTRVEALPHFPTSLSQEEWLYADKLARAHPEVQKALFGQVGEVETDCLVTYTASADAPTYNHRVVRLFFRRGRDYLLYGPGVEVDLTTETVRVERTDKGHSDLLPAEAKE